MLPTSELFHVNAEQCSCVVLYETEQKYSTLRMSNREILAFQFQICYQHWSRSNNAAVIKAIIPNPQTHQYTDDEESLRWFHLKSFLKMFSTEQNTFFAEKWSLTWQPDEGSNFTNRWRGWIGDYDDNDTTLLYNTDDDGENDVAEPEGEEGEGRIFCDLHDDNTAAGTVLSELDNVKTLPTNEILGCLYDICTALGHKIARYLWRTGICCIDCDIMDCDVAMTMLSINVNNQDKSDDEGTWAVLRVVHCQHFVPKYWILGSCYEVADCVSRYCQR